MTAAIDKSCARFGPIWLVRGVSAWNFATLLYAAFFAIGLLTYVGSGTPYVMTAMLHIPAENQGVVTGQLVLWTEIVSIALFGPVGMLADRYGRKNLFAAGFALMGIGYALHPLVTSVSMLVLARIIYATGTAVCTGALGTVVTDYPQERTRGWAVAISGFFNGLGVALLNFMLGGLPRRLQAMGYDDVVAGTYTHWFVASLCFLSAVVIFFGLKGGTPAGASEEHNLIKIGKTALRHMRNPRIALAFAAAFVARGDLVILGSFLVLWGKNAGLENGLDLPTASRAGTLIFVTATSAALLWTLVIMFLLDRFNRVTMLAACLAIASAGFLGMGFVTDPLASADKPLIALLGIGQISAFFGSMSLLGQEAPVNERGTIIGGFNIAGALGIAFVSGVGGYLFDAFSPKAPFVMVGVLNGFVMLAAILVRKWAPGAAALGEPARAT